MLKIVFNHKSIPWIFTAVLVVFGALLTWTENYAKADPDSTHVWRPASTPTLNGTIQIGTDLHSGSAGTYVIKEGSTTLLSANSVDTDIYSINGVDQPPESDLSSIIWAWSDGSINSSRSDSGDSVTFTAPTVPTGQSSVTVTVTAIADDRWESSPGPDLNPDESGDRSDDPYEDESTTYIYIKVVKSGPNAIAGGTGMDCYTYANNTIWLTNIASAGSLFTQMTVSGPNPPTNWNGFIISESFAFNGGASTAVLNDFVNGFPGLGTLCVGGSTFEVGAAFPGTFNAVIETACVGVGTAATDKFWDFHYHINPVNDFNVSGPKTVVCDQTYSWCGNQIGQFHVTFSFTKDPGPGGVSTAVITKVSF